MTSIYKEEILEHYRNPLNFGKLLQFDVYSYQRNPLCGDEIEMCMKWGTRERRTRRDNKIVSKVRFMGKGCAISIAAASLLTEYVKGRSIVKLTNFSEASMLGLLGIEISETRKKCALLAFVVLKDCLQQFDNR